MSAWSNSTRGERSACAGGSAGTSASLSKKAVSYSSPSTTKCGPLPVAERPAEVERRRRRRAATDRVPARSSSRAEQRASSWSCRACRRRRSSGVPSIAKRGRARPGTSGTGCPRRRRACASGLSARDRVADHDEIGPVREHVLRVEAERDRSMPQLRERVAHRRIDVLVAAGDLDAARVQQARERAHAGARDRDEVHVFQRVERRCRWTRRRRRESGRGVREHGARRYHARVRATSSARSRGF